MTSSAPPTKRVAIVQSCYIPWKGYFDLIHRVDEFILYDDVQYTKRDWRNRNQIKTANGLAWLSIPVDVKGKYLQAVKDTTVSDQNWAARHWKTVQASYARATHFREYKQVIEDLFRGCGATRLSEINHHFLSRICRMLEISTPLTWSMDYAYDRESGKTESLVDLCRRAGATAYLSGPSARAYLDPAVFAAAGISLSFMDYQGYPEYPQPYPPFEHHVSILDVILNTGPAARSCTLPLVLK
jgi:hypothetical protein